MKNLYSPSMLKSYLSCKYTIFNEVNEKKLNLKKIELSKNDQLRYFYNIILIEGEWRNW